MGAFARPKAFRIWEEIQALPIAVSEISANEQLLDLAVYDAMYLSISMEHKLPLATVDRKLQKAAETAGIEVIQP